MGLISQEQAKRNRLVKIEQAFKDFKWVWNNGKYMNKFQQQRAIKDLITKLLEV